MIGLIATPICNLNSVQGALNRYQVAYKIVNTPEDASQMDRLILPGVGHAQAGMKFLNEAGWSEFIPSYQRPFLGICLGAQLMGVSSEEGPTSGLGVLPQKVVRFLGKERVPQMGWNWVKPLKPHAVLEGLQKTFAVYYANSYFYPESQWTIAATQYETSISAIIAKDNFLGIQFHPERSSQVGEVIMKNFSRWSCS